MASIEAASLFSVKGQVIVITGGGSGIGAMMANTLDANGAAKVYILGRRAASLEKVASAAKNKSIFPIVCDVTSKSSLLAAATTIAAQTPFINTLIANAGIAGPADALKTFTTTPPTIEELQAHLWSTTEAEANAVSSMNVIASHFTFLAFLKLLDAGNTHTDSIGKEGYVSSQFITTSSIAGLIRKNILGYPYSASKAALTHYTKMLATEFAPYKIRANTIAPGFFRTEATEFMVEGVPQGVDLSVPGNMPGVNPALRAGDEQDIAGSLLYLASRAGSFVNGAVLLVDGGAVSVRTATY